MSGTENPLVLFDRVKTGGFSRLLAGVDEAGRGCWAGPVVAAAVILPADWCPEGLDDSKKLTAKKREVLCSEICASALSWGACAVSAPVVDKINILQATMLAMGRSVGKLSLNPDLVLIDGTQIPDIQFPAEPLVKGDATSAAIAAASILAKTFRDRIMCVWHRHYPEYGFSSHKGYGAAMHQEALARLGPCPLHRFSYKPIANLNQGRLF